MSTTCPKCRKTMRPIPGRPIHVDLGNGSTMTDLRCPCGMESVEYGTAPTPAQR